LVLDEGSRTAEGDSQNASAFWARFSAPAGRGQLAGGLGQFHASYVDCQPDYPKVALAIYLDYFHKSLRPLQFSATSADGH
jgi:hypothetical protein